MSHPTLAPGELFTVQEYQYTTFEFGSDRHYSERYGKPSDSNAVWAFPHAAVISNPPAPRPVITGPHLSFGDVVNVPGYGTFRILRDHNRNVKFEPIAE